MIYKFYNHNIIFYYIILLLQFYYYNYFLILDFIIFILKYLNILNNNLTIANFKNKY